VTYERVLAWCKNESDNLRQLLDALESGRVTTGEKLPGSPSPADTTAETIKDVKRKIAELDSLL